MNSEVDILARTIWGEARGESAEGQEAVAAVICNRVARGARQMRKFGTPHPLYGDGTFERACLAKKQFSCWNPGDPNRDKMLSFDLATIPAIVEIAERAVAGTLLAPIGVATHYLTERAFLAAPEDHWCRKNPPLCQIGAHLFFKEP